MYSIGPKHVIFCTIHVFNPNRDLLWLTRLGVGHCGALLLLVSLNWRPSLHASFCVCICFWRSLKVQVTLNNSSYPDSFPVHNVKGLWFSKKLFRLNPDSDPRSSTEHLPRQPFIIVSTPTPSPAPDMTDTELDSIVHNTGTALRQQGMGGYDQHTVPCYSCHLK